jgi:ABC-2 type transport system ATP-binding protein
VLGQDVRHASHDVRRDIGFLPDVPGFYPWMTARDFLRFAGNLFGLDSRTLAARIDSLLDMAGLASVNAKIGGYSRGMKQRLGLAQALINAPRLLLLDEPTSALDPIGRREVLEMIASLGGAPRCSSPPHPGDVERSVIPRPSCTRSRGRDAPVADEAPGRRGGSSWKGRRCARAGRSDGRGALRTADPSGSSPGSPSSALAQAQRAIPEAVAGLGLGLRRFELAEASLEEVFVELVGGTKS